MSQYTIQLRWIIEQAEKDAHGSYTPFEYTDATWKALGLDSYPIYDESYRDKLNSMICDHYYMREIGQEAPGLFRLVVRRTMNEIMPYYNELYRIAAQQYDPLNEIDVKRLTLWNDKADRSWDSQSDGTNESTTSGNSSNVYSDTPMSMISDDGGSLIKNGEYATNATFDNSTSTSSATTGGHSNGTDGTTRGGDRTETESGHRKSIPELIQEWRRAILNVNREIVESSELAECFMLCY